MEVASTDGDRAYGERTSGGNDVWRRGWAGTEDKVDAFRRLPGGPLTSSVDDRFLFGSCDGDGFGGDMARGEVVYGGDAMVSVGQ